MSDNTNVLFSRSDLNNPDEDVWDDRALIRAYEKAVGKVKHDLNKNLISDESSNKKHQKSQKKGSKKFDAEESDDYKTDKQVPASNKEWKVGDECFGVFEDDGLMYPAKIIEINEDEQTCVIRYDYYDNEEEKDLNELYDQIEQYESFEDIDNNAEEDVEDEEEQVAEVKEKKKVTEKKRRNRKSTKESESAEFTYNPLAGSDISIPPPPPPALTQSMLVKLSNIAEKQTKTSAKFDENDALYSMLMSWYISGYNTGYYIGAAQKQSKKTK